MIVETVFELPGVGRLVVQAIHDRDLAVVQGFVLLFGTVVLLLNLAVDLLYAVLDPARAGVRLPGGMTGAC